MRYAIVLFVFILTSCGSTGVVPMDLETYMIAKRSVRAGYGPPDDAKADVYREANEFCAKDTLVIETINLEITNASFARPGNVSLTFRCINKKQ